MAEKVRRYGDLEVPRKIEKLVALVDENVRLERKTLVWVNMVDVLRDLQAAVGQLPTPEHAAEAEPLRVEWQKIQDGGRRGPQLLGDILPIVLARLGVGVLQSNESGE